MKMTSPAGAEAYACSLRAQLGFSDKDPHVMSEALSFVPTFPSSAIFTMLGCYLFLSLVREKVFGALLGIQKQHPDDCMKNERDQMSLDFFFFFLSLWHRFYR